MKQPSWSDVDPSLPKSYDKLSVRDVPTIRLDALSGLASTGDAAARWATARGWLDDPRRYDSVPTTANCPETRVAGKHIATLLKHDIIAATPADACAGPCRFFLIPRHHKHDMRPIKHTTAVNEVLGADTLQRVRFPSKADIAQLVHAGEYFIAFDFTAYFDQFKYADAISHRFCFRKRNKVYRLLRLAMGQRQAVEVASTATDVMRLFPGARARSHAVIDNVIFVGSREDVLHDAAIFVDRVRACNALLNEDTSNLPALLQQRGEWCGVALDLVAKTTQLTQKTLEKLRVSWSNRTRWTWRTFASHIGLLFWGWGILDLPMAEFFPLLRFVSHAGRLLTESPHLWDAPASVWPSAVPALEQWTQIALANAPRTVPAVATPDWLVCTDASRWGWSYVALDEATGNIRWHGAPWSEQMRRDYGDRLGRSTFTEPHAILNAMCHLLRPGDRSLHVRVGTDSSVSQAAYRRGFNSHSFDINECLRRLNRTFAGRVTFEFVHIPGYANPADGLSRGAGTLVGDEAAHADCLRRLLGHERAQLGGAALQAHSPR